MLTHQPFLALNASKPRSKVTEIRPGVVLRSSAEPDRSHVEGASKLVTPPVEPPAALKNASPATAETRIVAIARITSLVKAGQTRRAAIGSVSKELGYSYGAVNKWLVDANKKAREVAVVAKKRAKKAKKQEARTGTKKAFVLAHPDVSPKELVALAKKQGLSITSAYAYTVRSANKGTNGSKTRKPRTQRVEPQPSNGARSIGYLIDTAVSAIEEIKRRLSALSL